jgi:hypothetical protein
LRTALMLTAAIFLLRYSRLKLRGA